MPNRQCARPILHAAALIMGASLPVQPGSAQEDSRTVATYENPVKRATGPYGGSSFAESR
jgi:hypothetical protein